MSWRQETVQRERRGRGPAHSTEMFRKAFSRVYLIIHGGQAVEHTTGALDDPPVQARRSRRTPSFRSSGTRRASEPRPPGNSAQAYYPGDRYVDVVGDDLYDIRGKAQWRQRAPLLARTPRSRSRSPSGASGASTTRRSCSRWRFVQNHRRSSCSRTSTPSRARFSTSRPSREPRAPTSVIVPLGLAWMSGAMHAWDKTHSIA